MHGSSIYQYTHPCDHNDIQELLAACSHADGHHGDKEFFIRLKCALSAAGRNVQRQLNVTVQGNGYALFFT